MSRQPSDGTSLAALVREYLDTGNQAAVEELFRRTRPKLLSVAARITGDGDAEDVTQSAYLSLFRKAEVPEDLPVQPWLVTATVRIAYRQRALDQREALSNDLLRLGIPLLNASTDAAPFTLLQQFYGENRR